MSQGESFIHVMVRYEAVVFIQVQSKHWPAQITAVPSLSVKAPPTGHSIAMVSHLPTHFSVKFSKQISFLFVMFKIISP